MVACHGTSNCWIYIIYLRNDLEPDIDADTVETFGYRLTNLRVVSIFEPQCQQPQGVLKRVVRRQRYGLEERLDGRHDVSREDLRW